MMSETLCSDPWPSDHYPLVIRGKDSAGKWMQGANVSLEPCPKSAQLYADRSLLPATVTLDKRETRLRVLVPPGDYTAHFTRGSETVSTEATVLDPKLLTVNEVGPDGYDLYYRDHKWDRYIARENSYHKLVMKSSDVVLDLGAHIGIFTRKAVVAGAEVIAYEPEPDNYRLLKLNTYQSAIIAAYDVATLVQAAVVSDDIDDNEINLWIDAGDATRTALHSLYRTRGARVPLAVPTFKWSEVLAAHKPTVLKVDVEGAERTYDWTVLSQHPELRAVALEIENNTKKFPDSVERIEAALEEAGFVKVHQTRGWSTVQLWERQ